MTHPFGTPLVIANPAAGRGSQAVLPRLISALREHDIAVDVDVTDRPGAATTLARAAVDGGRRYLVVVGGDGTVQQVVEGMVDLGSGTARGEQLVLAVVPAGSGSDLPRTFGLDRSPEQLARHLATTDLAPLDVGRVELTGLDGRPSTRAFVNVAQAGFGASVVRAAHRLPRRLGQARYKAAIAMMLPRLRSAPATVTIDADVRTDPLINLVVANGQFFGGGLHVAPRALPGSGRFNVQTWDVEPRDVPAAMPQLRRGRHLARPDVREWQSKTVTVEAPTPLPVEVDGEVVGTTTAVFDVLPGLLQYKL